MLVAVATPGPNEEHTFETDGKYDPVPDAHNIIRSHHVSALVAGSSITTIPGYGSYQSSGFAHDSPQWPGKQTGPYSETAHAQAGPEGCTYVCFTAHKDVKLDYEVFVGPHEYQTPDNMDVCAVVARGNACIGGVGACELWKVHNIGPRFNSVVEAEEDAIVFYLWARTD